MNKKLDVEYFDNDALKSFDNNPNVIYFTRVIRDAEDGEILNISVSRVIKNNMGE